MVITITEKSLIGRGHYLKSRRLNRAVEILGIAVCIHFRGKLRDP